METIRKKDWLKWKECLTSGCPSLFLLPLPGNCETHNTGPRNRTGYTSNVLKHWATSPTSTYLTFFSVHLILGCPSAYFSQPLISLLSSSAHEPLTMCLACYCNKYGDYSLNNKLYWSKSLENFPNPLSKVLSIIIQRQIELQNPSHGE